MAAAAAAGLVPSFNPSIWGASSSGGAPGRNGFLNTAGLSHGGAERKAERDLAYAREAGLLCPLTKTVICDPVVASDGWVSAFTSSGLRAEVLLRFRIRPVGASH